MTPTPEESTASILTVDFRETPDIRQHASGKLRDKLPTQMAPRTPDGKSLSPKQIRERARRKAKRMARMTDQELDYLYRKPVEEWDLEELARGRARGPDGTFRGPRPKWITAEVHERAMERYVAMVKSEMNSMTVTALESLTTLLSSEEVDFKGRPLVSANVKADIAKFLLEHVVGKPKQHVQADVSVKLQGILASVMANPGQTFGPQSNYTVGHLPGVTMPIGEADSDVIDAEYEEAITDG